MNYMIQIIFINLYNLNLNLYKLNLLLNSLIYIKIMYIITFLYILKFVFYHLLKYSNARYFLLKIKSVYI